MLDHARKKQGNLVIILLDLKNTSDEFDHELIIPSCTRSHYST